MSRPNEKGVLINSVAAVDSEPIFVIVVINLTVSFYPFTARSLSNSAFNSNIFLVTEVEFINFTYSLRYWIFWHIKFKQYDNHYRINYIN